MTGGGHGYQFRAPWYARESAGLGLNDPRAFAPAIQMYDRPEFVTRLAADPSNHLKFTPEDRWSYPVPVAFPAPGTGRERFATSRLVTTGLRKLFQPNHDRFYAVVSELFCDEPGLPRAGAHRDLTVRFVLRRQRFAYEGTKSQAWRLAKDLMLDLYDRQYKGKGTVSAKGTNVGDLDDLWWADPAERERFEATHGDLIGQLGARTVVQRWLVDPATGTGRWADPGDTRPGESEQDYPMWRLPGRDGVCGAANTRALWFGLIPTFSSEHWADPASPGRRPVPKLDEKAIYQIHCRVVEDRGDCPARVSESEPTEPFRLAAPYDPDGTKNRAATITAPDLRTLAARAGKPPGPGGLAISTPPGSGLSFNPFGGVPKPGSGSLGGGGICTFAFELFFIVSLFLFLMFLPIVVFAFQLWWMLALRFCFPRLTIQIQALATFFAAAHVDVVADAQADLQVRVALNDVFGITVPPGSADPGIAASLQASPAFPHDLLQDLASVTDPSGVPEPAPPPAEPSRPDPLCGAGP
ncbi:hypothetical protein [Longispora albida]|uniref:hypothetical protein n=1 Tax=Longispora albida TaxID=203523 RepID=UPI0003793195|nr:hypothetical protein [Longispora albida]